MLVFKSLHILTLSYLFEHVHLHALARVLRSTHQVLLDVPRCLLKTLGDRAFAVAAPMLWNSLLLYIRVAQTFDGFKSLHKYIYLPLKLVEHDTCCYFVFFYLMWLF